MQNIINLCTRHTFINTKGGLGPAGLLLRENLRNEWLNYQLHNENSPVHLVADNLDRAAIFQQYGGDKLTETTGAIQIKPIDGPNIGEFRLKQENILKCMFFVPEHLGKWFYFSYMKDKYFWWRRLSLQPSQYKMGELQNEKDAQTRSADIECTHVDGKFALETIQLDKLTEKISLVESTVCLETMTANFICNSYDKVVKNGDNPTTKEVLRFHRKLAPYKLSIVISYTNPECVDDLKDLAKYIRGKLAKTQLAVYSADVDSAYESSKIAGFDLFHRLDEMGVPYTIVLNDSTLDSGLFKLRSRDTTLCENLHLSSLESYVELLFKNY